MKCHDGKIKWSMKITIYTYKLFALFIDLQYSALSISYCSINYMYYTASNGMIIMNHEGRKKVAIAYCKMLSENLTGKPYTGIQKMWGEKTQQQPGLAAEIK